MAILTITNRDYPNVTCAWKSGNAFGNFPLLKGGTHKVGDIVEGKMTFGWWAKNEHISDHDLESHGSSYGPGEVTLVLGNEPGKVPG